VSPQNSIPPILGSGHSYFLNNKVKFFYKINTAAIGIMTKFIGSSVLQLPAIHNKRFFGLNKNKESQKLAQGGYK
jgi:hypothetical protein